MQNISLQTRIDYAKYIFVCKIYPYRLELTMQSINYRLELTMIGCEEMLPVKYQESGLNCPLIFSLMYSD